MRFRYTFKQKKFMPEKMSFLSPFLSFYSLVFPFKVYYAYICFA